MNLTIDSIRKQLIPFACFMILGRRLLCIEGHCVWILILLLLLVLTANNKLGLLWIAMSASNMLPSLYLSTLLLWTTESHVQLPTWTLHLQILNSHQFVPTWTCHHPPQTTLPTDFSDSTEASAAPPPIAQEKSPGLSLTSPFFHFPYLIHQQTPAALPLK